MLNFSFIFFFHLYHLFVLIARHSPSSPWPHATGIHRFYRVVSVVCEGGADARTRFGRINNNVQTVVGDYTYVLYGTTTTLPAKSLIRRNLSAATTAPATTIISSVGSRVASTRVRRVSSEYEIRPRACVEIGTNQRGQREKSQKIYYRWCTK